MTIPTIQASLNAGELSPQLFGRVDLNKYRSGTSTLRNFWASYRGGAVSRAGTRFCGFTKQGQLGHANSVPPPRNVTFQFSVTQGIVLEFGEGYLRFLTNGGYLTETPQAITTINHASPGVFTVPGHGFANAEEVFLVGLGGMTSLNSQSYLVDTVTTNTFTLLSTLDRDPISTENLPNYTGGGTAARIYTIGSPYAASELPALKWAQSADVMSFTHPNHPPYDLVRHSATNWTFTRTAFGSVLVPPAFVQLAEVDSGISTPSFYYQFVATAVDAGTGEESVASEVGTILAVDMATEAATIFINCATVAGAGSYNFYSGPITFQNQPTSGSLFGYIGTSFGPAFTDTNVLPDFTVSPPLHTNPFATSSITAVTMTAGGTSYSPTATTVSVTSPIGRNPILLPVVVDGAVVWVSVQSAGEGLTGGEAVNFADATGAGSGAAATFSLGPATGTYPSVVSYFQQRRFYAATLNNPDTYFASQPGAFTNFDTSLPVKEDDAIVGSPWSQQVNGIQWMVNMPGGLVILTGLGAWQLSGGSTGYATASAVTPSSQIASPQAYNGISPTVPPIIISYDILYVQEKGSIVRNFSYNYFVNIYTGTDTTTLSNHLFDGHTIIQWGWAEEPNKLVWCVRDDGILLCLTYLKEQEVYAWSRHDTNGLFQSVCVVSEPPVNAPYFIVKRAIQNNGDIRWVYCQERMDNRTWLTLDQAWCVDCGLSYTPNTPAAQITVSSASGVPTLQVPTVTYGGANYGPNTYAELADPTGSGALVTLTVSGGVVTAAILTGTRTGYTDPQIVVIDPSGAGGNAVVAITVQNIATVSASAPIFANVAGRGEPGDVIRMNGRVMAVTAYLGPSLLTVNVLRNDAPSINDDPFNTPQPVAAGGWTIAAPITVVQGLGHLEGMLVSILADGVIITPQIVTGGAITLPEPATSIVAGLGFTAQLQTLYLDIPGGITVQGRRKEIDSVVVRIAASATPFELGTNQPDASVQPSGANVPWTHMTAVQTPIVTAETPLQPWELYTGDIFADVVDGLGGDRGQIAVQQAAPVPLSVLAVVNWARIQDDPDVG